MHFRAFPAPANGPAPQQEADLKTKTTEDRAANIRARVEWLFDSDRSGPCPKALPSPQRPAK